MEGELDPKTGESIWSQKQNKVLRKPGISETLADFDAGINVKPGEKVGDYLKRVRKDEVLEDVASINPLTGLWTLKEREKTWALDIDKNELIFSARLINSSLSFL